MATLTGVFRSRNPAPRTHSRMEIVPSVGQEPEETGHGTGHRRDQDPLASDAIREDAAQKAGKRPHQQEQGQDLAGRYGRVSAQNQQQGEKRDKRHLLGRAQDDQSEQQQQRSGSGP